ncbi:hypothetical protein NC652_015225 [Populus alba x Populus x berolinensis]|nr:hypothetical protein NC652_015225 [Populus alba x Populus x berolinensis]
MGFGEILVERRTKYHEDWPVKVSFKDNCVLDLSCPFSAA